MEINQRYRKVDQEINWPEYSVLNENESDVISESLSPLITPPHFLIHSGISVEHYSGNESHYIDGDEKPDHSQADFACLMSALTPLNISQGHRNDRIVVDHETLTHIFVASISSLL